MSKFLTYNGPLDESLEFLTENNAKSASVPDYIDFINNNEISNDSYDGFVRTKECFIYIPIFSDITNPGIENPNRPGGVWFNTTSPIIKNSKEATDAHKRNTKFRLNGNVKGSLDGAINHHMSLINLPINSMGQYQITEKMFGKDVTKYQKILKKLGIENIHLDFYNRNEINNEEFPFADQVLIYLDKEEKQLSITGRANRLYGNQRTLGIADN